MPDEFGDPGWWADLRAKVSAGDAVLGAWYSELSCALTLGFHPWNRPHMAVGGTTVPQLTPDCCGEPMRWRPSGWSCRAGCATPAFC